MKRAFTIVELMMVVAIIAVLLTLVATAASSSIRSARSQRANALIGAVQTGLATYYAQEDEWPGSLGDKVKNGFTAGTNTESEDGKTDHNTYVLSDSEVREMVKALVDKAKEGNPLMDISALIVSRDPGEKDGKGRGLDFMSAVRGTKKSPKKMKTAEMYFGYQDPNTGYFRRFKMTYSIPTDQLTVSLQ